MAGDGSSSDSQMSLVEQLLEAQRLLDALFMALRSGGDDYIQTLTGVFEAPLRAQVQGAIDTVAIVTQTWSSHLEMAGTDAVFTAAQSTTTCEELSCAETSSGMEIPQVLLQPGVRMAAPQASPDSEVIPVLPHTWPRAGMMMALPASSMEPEDIPVLPSTWPNPGSAPGAYQAAVSPASTVAAPHLAAVTEDDLAPTLPVIPRGEQRTDHRQGRTWVVFCGEPAAAQQVEPAPLPQGPDDVSDSGSECGDVEASPQMQDVGLRTAHVDQLQEGQTYRFLYRSTTDAAARWREAQLIKDCGSTLVVQSADLRAKKYTKARVEAVMEFTTASQSAHRHAGSQASSSNGPAGPSETHSGEEAIQGMTPALSKAMKRKCPELYEKWSIEQRQIKRLRDSLNVTPGDVETTALLERHRARSLELASQGRAAVRARVRANRDQAGVANLHYTNRAKALQEHLVAMSQELEQANVHHSDVFSTALQSFEEHEDCC